MILTIHCDGGARGNPGHSAYAFVVGKNNKTIYEGSGYLGIKTNNYAEYSALVAALEWLSHNKTKLVDIEEYLIVLDSELVVKQMLGLYKVKSANLKELVLKAKNLERETGLKITYKHVPRNRNKVADGLVNKTIDENS